MEIGLTGKTATKTGLTTTVHAIKESSEAERKATEAFGEDFQSSLIQSSEIDKTVIAGAGIGWWK